MNVVIVMIRFVKRLVLARRQAAANWQYVYTVSGKKMEPLCNQNLYFRIPRVVQQRKYGVVKSITCTFVGNFMRFPAAKKCENVLRITKWLHFFPDTV